MLHIRASAATALDDYLAVVAYGGDRTGSVIEVRLVGVDKVPLRERQVVAFLFQCRLSEHYANGVLADGLVVGKSVFNLPRRLVTLVCAGRRMTVTGVVTGKVVISDLCRLVAPKRLFGTPREMILQIVVELQVE